MWLITCNDIDPKCTTFARSHDWKPGVALPVRFRMLDDDRNVCYHGEMDLESSQGTEEQVFAPLDQYGTPDSGCTELQFLENGRWLTV